MLLSWWQTLIVIFIAIIVQLIILAFRIRKKSRGKRQINLGKDNDFFSQPPADLPTEPQSHQLDTADQRPIMSGEPDASHQSFSIRYSKPEKTLAAILDWLKN
jgi:hypothetical protein